MEIIPTEVVKPEEIKLTRQQHKLFRKNLRTVQHYEQSPLGPRRNRRQWVRKRCVRE